MTKTSVFQNRWAAALLIIAAVFAVYCNSLGSEWIIDDPALFGQQNQFYRTPSNLKKVFSGELLTRFMSSSSDFSQEEVSFSGFIAFRPVTALSFFVDAALWDNQPWGLRLHNIILHSIVAILVGIIAFKIFGTLQIGLLSGLIFAVHPVHVELINNAGYRSDLICALFFCAAFLSYLRWREGTARINLYRFLTAFLALAAMLSKELGFLFPFVILFYEYLIVPQEGSRRRPAILPLALALFCVSAVYIYFYFVAFPNTDRAYGLHQMLNPQNRIISFAIFVSYLKGLFLPMFVTVAPPLYTPSLQASISPAFLGLMLTGVLFSAAVFWRKRHPRLAFGVFWFLLLYIPTSGVFELVSSMGWRYLYLPSVGLIIVAAAWLDRLCFLMKRNKDWASLSKAPARVFIFLCAVTTITLNPLYRNNAVNAQAMLRDYPDSRSGHLILGHHYFEEGRYQAAADHYQQYLEHDIDNTQQKYTVLYQLGLSYLGLGDWTLADTYLQQALDITKRMPVVYRKLGLVALLDGRPDEAAGYANRALLRGDHTAENYGVLIESHIKLNKAKLAREYYAELSRQFPRDQNLEYFKEILAK